MKLVFATNNKHKLDEVRKITSRHPVEIVDRSHARPRVRGFLFGAGGFVDATEATVSRQVQSEDLDRVKEVMRTPALIDLRNIYRPDDVRGRGFKYASIGRA